MAAVVAWALTDTTSLRAYRDCKKLWVSPNLMKVGEPRGQLADIGQSTRPTDERRKRERAAACSKIPGR